MTTATISIFLFVDWGIFNDYFAIKSCDLRFCPQLNSDSLIMRGEKWGVLLHPCSLTLQPTDITDIIQKDMSNSKNFTSQVE